MFVTMQWVKKLWFYYPEDMHPAVRLVITYFQLHLQLNFSDSKAVTVRDVGELQKQLETRQLLVLLFLTTKCLI